MQEKLLQQVPVAEEDVPTYPTANSQDQPLVQQTQAAQQYPSNNIHYTPNVNATDKHGLTAPSVNVQYNHGVSHMIGYRQPINNGYHLTQHISPYGNNQSDIRNVSNNAVPAANMHHQQTVPLSESIGKWQGKSTMGPNNVSTIDSVNNAKSKTDPINYVKTTVDPLNNVKSTVELVTNLNYEEQNRQLNNQTHTSPVDNQVTVTIPPVTTILRKQESPSNQQLQYAPNHMPYLMPPFCHLAEQQRVSSPQNMTYLTPSRNSPVVSAFQTPQWQHTRKLKPRRMSTPTDGDTDKSCDEEEIDVVNEHHGNTRSVDTSKDSDISMVSNQSSKSSSPSGSSTGSPGSATTSPFLEEGPKKKARTNYSPSQVQALEKVFHENPYPDAEKMETLSKELEIPDGKIKVWFQNKRARWRRRAHDNTHLPQYMAHLSPVLSPMAPYGFMGHMMGASPPAQVVPGHFMFPGAPTSPAPSTHQNHSMASPYQSRGQLAPYFPVYPYGMIPPYYCSS